MISAKSTLAHMPIRYDTVVGAVQDVGAMVRESADPISEATRIVALITGVTERFTDVNVALAVAQNVVQVAIKNDTFDPQQAIDEGKSIDARLRASQPWLFAVSSKVDTPSETVHVGTAEVAVAVNAQGKIKKGGKEVLAVELYRVHVMEAATPVPNSEFIQILMKELGMSKAGATTYAWNCRKKFNPESIKTKAKNHG